MDHIMSWTKPGPGRPKGEPWKRYNLSVSVDSADKATLIRLAKKRDITVTELIRTYIAWGIEADSK